MSGEKKEKAEQIEALHQRTGVPLEILEKLPDEKLTACFNKSAETESRRRILFNCAAAATLIAAGGAAMAHGMPFEEGPGVVMSFGFAFAWAASKNISDRRNNRKLAAEIMAESRKAAPTSKM